MYPVFSFPLTSKINIQWLLLLIYSNQPLCRGPYWHYLHTPMTGITANSAHLCHLSSCHGNIGKQTNCSHLCWIMRQYPILEKVTSSTPSKFRFDIWDTFNFWLHRFLMGGFKRESQWKFCYSNTRIFKSIIFTMFNLQVGKIFMIMCVTSS